MKVRIFTAPTMQEAMLNIKEELGGDAVILHTRRYQKGGLLGYMGKEMVEVTAAVEDNIYEDESSFDGANDDEWESDTVVEERKSAKLDDFNRPNAAAASTPAEPESADETDFDLAPDPAPTAVKSVVEEQAEKILSLQYELEQMKAVLKQVISKSSPEENKITSVYDALLENEVDENIIKGIVESFVDKEALLNKNSSAALSSLESYFSRRGVRGAPVTVTDGETKLIALLGTTGVGKTTTLAKLAANFVLEYGYKVALITADTYRISAVEQLKTYSDIIGIPIEIVYSAEELKLAVNKHADKHVVLIDTAGRSQHNEYQVNELKELLDVCPNVEKHLVLSATTKYKDAMDIIRKFSICIPNRILFTKIDETASYGMIVNVIHEFPLAVSYITTGQSVPDDIKIANAQVLSELLLR